MDANSAIGNSSVYVATYEYSVKCLSECALYDLVLFFQWTNYLNPDNIKGLSALSMLLAMTGNGLMIPRALFTRDFMWYSIIHLSLFLYIYIMICLIGFSRMQLKLL